MRRAAIVRDAPVGGRGERVRCCGERGSGVIAALESRDNDSGVEVAW
jgi:hypothetical protein